MQRKDSDESIEIYIQIFLGLLLLPPSLSPIASSGKLSRDIRQCKCLSNVTWRLLDDNVSLKLITASNQNIHCTGRTNRVGFIRICVKSR